MVEYLLYRRKLGLAKQSGKGIRAGTTVNRGQIFRCLKRFHRIDGIFGEFSVDRQGREACDAVKPGLDEVLDIAAATIDDGTGSPGVRAPIAVNNQARTILLIQLGLDAFYHPNFGIYTIDTIHVKADAVALIQGGLNLSDGLGRGGAAPRGAGVGGYCGCNIDALAVTGIDGIVLGGSGIHMDEAVCDVAENPQSASSFRTGRHLSGCPAGNNNIGGLAFGVKGIGGAADSGIV